MTTSAQPLAKPVNLSFTQASNILDNPVVRRAYLVDAITVGLHMFNESQRRPYSSMLRALFTSITDEHICFGLFEGESPVALMRYSYVPDDMAQPCLEETDSQRNSLGSSARTKELQPVMDFVLGKMEHQIWNQVQFN